MKSFTYLAVAVLALATFASAGGKKHFTPGGTILDIQSPHGGISGKPTKRGLFGRRAVLNAQ